jgi:hypothetical protein
MLRPVEQRYGQKSCAEETCFDCRTAFFFFFFFDEVAMESHRDCCMAVNMEIAGVALLSWHYLRRVAVSVPGIASFGKYR